ncbi:MAG: hypothetical protein A3C06_01640 [Candidatus Taylorbacteria bacterium RIFCSPHIGHO2_02_FULL_46_13]|uniref:Uncharacterized protein n=1 Tax=Candidatus Taylorbacteria bacterium RIFCSPHIGHO2_02_FULL_46_13 TaxID=1802312 RepID=A0A1G2MR96_9BACT|nr:MAG: hypothetical protein A3C06_01640 [Candidatus Taylorbacteria bacterium RIFCSPHIGHO2_02_FULL_46_13]
MNPTVEFKVDGHSHLKEGEEMLLLSIRLLPSERGERKSIFFFSPERATATKGLLLRPLGRQKDSRSKYLGPGLALGFTSLYINRGFRTATPLHARAGRPEISLRDESR